MSNMHKLESDLSQWNEPGEVRSPSRLASIAAQTAMPERS